MSAIIRALKSIASGIQTAISAVIWFVEEIINLVKLVVSAFSDCIDIITSFIPSPLLAVIIGVITVAIIYKILGREG